MGPLHVRGDGGARGQVVHGEAQRERQRRTETKYRIARVVLEQQETALQATAKTDAQLEKASLFRQKQTEHKRALTLPLMEKIAACKVQRAKLSAEAEAKAKELHAQKVKAEAVREKLLLDVRATAKGKNSDPKKFAKAQAKRDALRREEQDRAEANHLKCLQAEKNLAKVLKERVARIEKRRVDVLRARSAPAATASAKSGDKPHGEAKKQKRGLQMATLGVYKRLIEL